ncbi:M16 family metallopeptidase [uncultured Rikenella sp.]|uniref:M16 family metallopeptidase n=1 Tax=uncultured Rikenella sp. TaxID=368003 RepID=UPI0026160EB2|nr:M16 family metallopeptidase [uncultured Rikenella sp.]
MKLHCRHILRPGLLLAAALLSTSHAFAQKPLPGETVPVDSSVRTGTLPSGITYYLKHNAKPADRADFHIYYKVGAIQEEDTQNGLAHFLEHMAFNGSQHFPDNSMIDWLSSVGVRFGENLNAATGQEQTTYMITNVPITRPGIVDSALLILHDWAGHITLDTADIDKERGVIIEEWRQGDNAQRRILEKQAPVLFNGSLYARRNVIGNQEVLKTFKYSELRDFYRRWYRPDMQAFVIVGDFDVDSMERKLRQTMADLKPAAVRTPKATITVADNEQPLVSVTSDPELTSTSVQILFRERPLIDRYDGMERLYREYLHSLAGRMLNERFAELSRQEDAPFLGAGGGYSPVVRPFDAFFLGATAREGEALRTLEALYTEAYRMQRGGFVQSELDRAKSDILRGTESYFANRNDRKNGEFVNGYMEHFENGAPYLTPEQDLRITRRILDAITLADVNAEAASWVHDRNSAILISMPEKAGVGLPTEAEVLAVAERVKNAEIEAYRDRVQGEKLMDASALKGSPTIQTETGKYGSTVMTLGNGVRVVVKSMELKADEVLMNAFQKGGQSTVAQVTDLYDLHVLPAYLDMAGVGSFSRTELDKLLTGKIAAVRPNIGSLSQGFSGSCSPRDIETLMQLVYLYYTAPRFDRSDWNILMNQYRSLLPNMVKDPNYILQDSLLQTVYGHNPRVFMLLSGKVLDAVSLERTEQLYRQFFSDANGMTFVFMGNIPADSLRPLAEKYLGSLPAARRKRAPQWGDHIVLPVPGVVQNMYKTPLQTPKVTAIELYTGELPYSLERSVDLEAIRYILEMRYTQSIREEKGGTYGVGVSLTYQKVPMPRFAYQIFFETDTARVGELLPLVAREIEALSAEGATVEELTKTKEFFLKKYRDGLIHNGTWLGYLTSWYLNDNDRYTGYEAAVQGLSAESIRRTAAAAFGQGNVCTVVQLPAEEEE